MKVFNNENKIKKKLNHSNLIFKLYKTAYFFLVVNLIFIYGCSAIKKKEKVDICSYSSLPCLLSTEYVLLITNKGKINKTDCLRYGIACLIVRYRNNQRLASINVIKDRMN